MALPPPFDRITIEPDKYPNHDELFREYPDLEPEDLKQALCFAAAHLDNEISLLFDVA